MPFVVERLRLLWDRLRRRRGPGDDGLEPALVGVGPRDPRPSSAVALEPPESYEFDDHADHPRSTGE
jgi:hypothetical protein